MLRFIKSFFTPEQRRRIRGVIDAIKAPCERQARRFRARHFERGITHRPNGRVWRSAVPFDLNISMQRGVLGYTYRDVPMLKFPTEIALYTLLLWQLKPKTIVEIGAFAGGSALWFADQMRTYGIDGRVIAVDIEQPTPPYRRDEIVFMRGDANKLGETLTPEFIGGLARPLLVVEDASHHHDATLATLRFFDPFMRPGDYIVVEDGNVSDMGDDVHRAGGPGLAISEFLLETKDRYEIDTSYCDRYGHNVTSNPNGYIRCLR